MYNLLYRLVENVRRCWYYLPIIWRDREWDQGFLLFLLKAKLIRMEKYFQQSGLVEGSSHIAQQIRYTIDLLAKVDNPARTWKKLDKCIDLRYGEIEMRKPAGRGIQITGSLVRTSAEHRRYRELTMELHRKQVVEVERNRKKLANVFQHTIWHWWD